MSDDLAEKARRWVSKNGYPLEMRVARAFRDGGGGARLAAHYMDQDLEKPREIDVVGYFHNSRDASAKVDIELACLVECKHDTTKPWMGFVDSKPSGSPRFTWLHYPSSKYWRECFVRNRRVFRKHPVSLFKRGEVAYGLAAMKFGDEKEPANSHNVAYEAVVGAAKAARFDVDSLDDLDNFVKLSVPVVVTETRLFVCRLNDSGDDFTIDEVDSLVHDVVTSSRGLLVTPVNIVREHALPALIRSVSDSVEELNAAFADPRFDLPPSAEPVPPST